MHVPWLSVGVSAAAVAMGVLRDESALKEDYSSMFTESSSSGAVKHPGNAYSSFAYAWLALWLATRKTVAMRWSRQSDAAVLAWLSVVSFRFHMTESLWIETQDLWCVIYLCLACVARYMEGDDVRAMLLTWLAMAGLLADAAWQGVGEAVVEEHYMGIIGVLVYFLLRYSVGAWLQLLSLALGFGVKVADMWFAQDGQHTSVVANGTSLFHVLTAVALWLHYRSVVVGSAEFHQVPQSVV